MLGEPVRSVAEALGQLAAIQRACGTRYRAMLDHVALLGRPTAICTIYDVGVPEPDLHKRANAALGLLNYVITREAACRGLPVLDLRVLLDKETDSAKPIEPSSRGGEKLAAGIVQVVAQHDFNRALACLYPTGTGL